MIKYFDITHDNICSRPFLMNRSTALKPKEFLFVNPSRQFKCSVEDPALKKQSMRPIRISFRSAERFKNDFRVEFVDSSIKQNNNDSFVKKDCFKINTELKKSSAMSRSSFTHFLNNIKFKSKPFVRKNNTKKLPERFQCKTKWTYLSSCFQRGSVCNRNSRTKQQLEDSPQKQVVVEQLGRTVEGGKLRKSSLVTADFKIISFRGRKDSKPRLKSSSIKEKDLGNLSFDKNIIYANMLKSSNRFRDSEVAGKSQLFQRNESEDRSVHSDSSGSGLNSLIFRKVHQGNGDEGVASYLNLYAPKQKTGYSSRNSMEGSHSQLFLADDFQREASQISGFIEAEKEERILSV